MDTPNFLITNYIADNNLKDCQHLKDNLHNLGIIMKDYPEDNLILLYNKFNYNMKKKLELECRSIVLNRTTFEIVCYTCPTPIYNINAMNFLVKNSTENKDIYECYEGALLSIFYFNDKWFVSSRRCINKSNNLDDNKHFKMFNDVLVHDGYKSFENFTTFLNKNLSYYFTLIHHEDENIVNYNLTFGENYKKLCFVFARDRLTQKEYKSEEIDNNFISENIFLPTKLENEKEFDKHNMSENILEPPNTEGIVIKVNNLLLKLQTLNYQFHNSIGNNKNIYKGFLKLYQTNNLKSYLEKNDKFSRITNPINTSESFDTLGIIDSIFKVLTTELHELFSLIWNEDTMEHLNTNLYKILPSIYKTLLYQIKGIYYKNNNTINYRLIYNYLKKIECDDLENLLKNRRLMLNWIIINNNSELEEFNKTLRKTKKILFKLTALYTNKLFPNITSKDIPTKE